MFAHVDADESGHLTHDELYHLLGVPKGEPVSKQRYAPQPCISSACCISEA